MRGALRMHCSASPKSAVAGWVLFLACCLVSPHRLFGCASTYNLRRRSKHLAYSTSPEHPWILHGWHTEGRFLLYAQAASRSGDPSDFPENARECISGNGSQNTEVEQPALPVFRDTPQNRAEILLGPRIQPILQAAGSRALERDLEEMTTGDNLRPPPAAVSRGARATLVAPALVAAAGAALIPLFFWKDLYNYNTPIGFRTFLEMLNLPTAAPNLLASDLDRRLRRKFSWINSVVILSIFICEGILFTRPGGKFALYSVILLALCFSASILLNASLLYSLPIGGRILQRFRAEFANEDAVEATDLIADPNLL